jgi:Ca2+-binding RTX toxin-like protein
MSAGGYDLVLPSGTYTVTFSGAGIASTTSQVTIGSINVKLDLIDPAAGGEPPPPPPGTIVGTEQGETLNGTANADTIRGLGGNDTLNGNAGNDSLDGGAGNDIPNGGSGNDTYIVDQSGDVVSESSGAGTDTVQASLSWTLGANVENLTLTGSNAIDGTGNSLSNAITGNAASNVLSGLSGNDTINGGGGADTLLGGSGNDTMNGGDANDILNGGTGLDGLTGGPGADRFVYTRTSESQTSGRDIIADFLHGSDTLDLSAIDARSGSANSGNQAFNFVGEAASVSPYAVSWYESGGNTIVQADVTGNTTADFALVLTGINLGLTQADFIL